MLGKLLKAGQIIIENEQGFHPQFNDLSLGGRSSFQADITCDCS
jgi:hypothetical protein